MSSFSLCLLRGVAAAFMEGRRSYADVVEGGGVKVRGIIVHGGARYENIAIRGDGNCCFRAIALALRSIIPE